MPLSALAARRLAAQQQAGQTQEPVSPETSRRDDGPSQDPSPSLDLERDVEKSTKGRKRKRSKEARLKQSPESPPVMAPPHHAKFDSRQPDAIDVVFDEKPQILIDETCMSEEASMADQITDNDEGLFENEIASGESHDDESYGSAERERDETMEVDARLSSIEDSALELGAQEGKISVTVTLPPGATLAAVGLFDLVVRKGSVVVLGALIHSSQMKHRIYAPSSHSLPAIKALQHPNTSAPTPAKITLAHCDDGIEKLDKLHPAFGRLWSGAERSFQVLIHSSNDTLRRPLRAMEEDAEWHNLAQHVMGGTNHGGPAPRVAVCGPKGSGKSSLVKFLTNALLSTSGCEEVMLLDIDPGQPEYSSPGDLSLHRVSQFNLGPPFTHPILDHERGSTIKTHHFGFSTPRDDTSHYLACVEDLFLAHEKSFSKSILLINCSGWVLGRGLETLQRLLDITNPSDVVYTSTEGPSEVASHLHARCNETHKDLHILRSVGSEVTQRSPADLRTMQALSYHHYRREPGAKAGAWWLETPLNEAIPEPWRLTGPQRLHGVALCHEPIHIDLVEAMVSGSAFAVVAVDSDEVPEQALRTDEEGEGAEIREASGFWVDDRARPGDDQAPSLKETDPPGVDSRSTMVIQRTGEDIPYLYSKDGSYRPLDPSKSRCLGHVYVQSVDTAEKTLNVVDTTLRNVSDKMDRGEGEKIVLVRGKADNSNWVVMEQYHRLLAGTRESPPQGSVVGDSGSYGVTTQNGVGGQVDNGQDMLQWAKVTPRIQVIDKTDADARRRMRPWRLRRNLEMTRG